MLYSTYVNVCLQLLVGKSDIQAFMVSVQVGCQIALNSILQDNQGKP